MLAYFAYQEIIFLEDSASVFTKGIFQSKLVIC